MIKSGIEFDHALHSTYPTHPSLVRRQHGGRAIRRQCGIHLLRHKHLPPHQQPTTPFNPPIIHASHTHPTSDVRSSRTTASVPDAMLASSSGNSGTGTCISFTVSCAVAGVLCCHRSMHYTQHASRLARASRSTVCDCLCACIMASVAARHVSCVSATDCNARSASPARPVLLQATQLLGAKHTLHQQAERRPHVHGRVVAELLQLWWCEMVGEWGVGIERRAGRR